MSQNAPFGPNPPDPQKPASNRQGSGTARFIRARIFLFVLFLILALSFYANPPIYSLFTILLILFTIPLFDPVTGTLLAGCEKVIAFLETPLKRLWQTFFTNHLTSLSRWSRRHRRTKIEVVSLIALTLLLAATTLRPYVTTAAGALNDLVCPTSLPWFACGSGYGVSVLPYGGVRIGVIGDNTYGPFDQSTLNQDEATVEKQIFGEDQLACTRQHITLIAVTTLSRTIEDPLSGAKLGVQNLLGDYLAQQKYNATNPPTRLCLVIANLGTPDTANNSSQLVKTCPACYSIPQVFRQMALLARSDPTIRGIVGFPLSQQVTEALATRTNYSSLATLPIVSPSASSDAFSNTPNFYRIDAPDQSQGQAIAQYLCSSLNFSGVSGPIVLQGNRTTSGHISDRTLATIYITRYNQNDGLQLLDSYTATIDTGQLQEAPLSNQLCL